ncbi:unnamed protein product [Ceratitis capitata]|uniref:(Mediterranean fruit fly) hypothetical protein n=1 Tax=Ceratitis capitata TaxID=7213 RepID=A0A811V8L9_CERCA|nr:unnamed protein product [Ceratitis capitata]
MFKQNLNSNFEILRVAVFPAIFQFKLMFAFCLWRKSPHEGALDFPILYAPHLSTPVKVTKECKSSEMPKSATKLGTPQLFLQSLGMLNLEIVPMNRLWARVVWAMRVKV